MRTKVRVPVGSGCAGLCIARMTTQGETPCVHIRYGSRAGQDARPDSPLENEVSVWSKSTWPRFKTSDFGVSFPDWLRGPRLRTKCALDLHCAAEPERNSSETTNIQ